MQQDRGVQRAAPGWSVNRMRRKGASATWTFRSQEGAGNLAHPLPLQLQLWLRLRRQLGPRRSALLGGVSVTGVAVAVAVAVVVCPDRSPAHATVCPSLFLYQRTSLPEVIALIAAAFPGVHCPISPTLPQAVSLIRLTPMLHPHRPFSVHLFNFKQHPSGTAGLGETGTRSSMVTRHCALTQFAQSRPSNNVTGSAC